MAVHDLIRGVVVAQILPSVFFSHEGYKLSASYYY